MKDPTFQLFFTYYLPTSFPTNATGPTPPIRESNPYIHIQFIGFIIFGILPQPIHLLSLNLHEEHTSTF